MVYVLFFIWCSSMSPCKNTSVLSPNFIIIFFSYPIQFKMGQISPGFGTPAYFVTWLIISLNCLAQYLLPATLSLGYYTSVFDFVLADVQESVEASRREDLNGAGAANVASVIADVNPSGKKKWVRVFGRDGGRLDVAEALGVEMADDGQRRWAWWVVFLIFTTSFSLEEEVNESEEKDENEGRASVE
ncbi:hypothetical protein L3X38_034360 [Prunus dulcis]|uniref:Uncharacterized protein n=1 Tax=Prunus dulcis TaxID=3755 RepID=A0AAD4VIR4_PRUDU|nr:hypothetical protein L3X38_034360 [Prunus dulcis]